MIQIDMQMPKCCSECYFAERDLSCGIIALSDMCQQNDKMYSVKKTAKPEYCPLKEVKRDNLSMLKEQEAVVHPEPSRGMIYITNCRCDSCGGYLIPEDNFCRCCGKRIEWMGVVGKSVKWE